MRLLVRTLPAILALAIGCATNPATGKSQLMLVSEGQEIQMGQSYAAQVKQSMPAVDNPTLQAYVSRIGLQLAKSSERPQLPWAFTVVDDPAVNAFALPGGPIFVTRGLLTTLNNEAELASVVGHETGHVTARHSAAQMSRQQVAQLGLGVGSILSEDVANLAGVASTGLGVLFLKYGRDDETQADALGFRYAYNNGYDVREMLHVFDQLARVGAAEGGGKVPEWQSTHPAPENRSAKTQQRLDSLGKNLSAAKVNRDEYLRTIDGLIYGEDPRQGFFRGTTFYHPDLAFQITFPDGWKGANQPDAVVAQEPNGAAATQLKVTAGTPDQALQQFTGQQAVLNSESASVQVAAGAARSAFFTAKQENGTIAGLVTYVAYGGKTYQLLSITAANTLGTYQNLFRQVHGSFRAVTDRAILGAQPNRLKIVTVPRAMSIDQFHQEFPSSVALEKVLLVNELTQGQMLKRGQLVKQIVAGTAR